MNGASQHLIDGIPTVPFDAFSAPFHRSAVAERIPIGVLFELTYRCNFDCVHCYVVQPSSAGELETAEVVRILRELREAGGVFLTFTGGEPLTRPDFAEIWRTARELGFVVSLFTNAARVSERTLELFAEYPPHKVEVTLYGAGEGTYQAVTQRRNMHTLVLRNVDRLRGLGLHVHLKGIGLDGNRDELPALLDEARKRGVESFFKFDNEITARTDCSRGPAEHRLTAEEIVVQDRDFPERIEELRRLYLRSRGRRVLTERMFRCGAAQFSLVVDPFGKMRTCALYRQEGWDLREGSVRAGWQRLEEIVQQPITRPSRCRSCDKVALCGACPGNNSLESGGDPEHPPDFLCRITYARVEGHMSDLRPRLEEPAGRWLPLSRTQDCQRPWLIREPVGEVIRPERRSRALPVASG